MSDNNIKMQPRGTLSGVKQPKHVDVPPGYWVGAIENEHGEGWQWFLDGEQPEDHPDTKLFPTMVDAVEAAWEMYHAQYHTHAGPEGYEDLAAVLQRALDQASKGKGKERHAQDLPFADQPMQNLISLYGPGFALGQAAKKAQESQRLPAGQDVHELLGAIVYLAGAIVHIEANCKQEEE